MPGSLKLVILIPVYNDWASAGVLIQQIDAAIRGDDVQASILIIDDGSTEEAPDDFVQDKFNILRSIDILHLRRNIGHQRAIAVGFTYIYKKVYCEAVLVMDSDGEDRPQDISNLIRNFRQTKRTRIVFAERKRRMETLLFKFFYRCYRLLHKLLTGLEVKVGNFSILPFSCLSALVVSPELWNHYAATVLKLGLPVKLVPCPRGARIFGKTKMNFVSLLIHGLSAISIYGEIVATRTLVTACTLSLSLVGILLAAVCIKIILDISVPPLVVYSTGLILLLLVLVLVTTWSFLLFVLMGRNMAPFIPLRDSGVYIKSVSPVYGYMRKGQDS